MKFKDYHLAQDVSILTQDIPGPKSQELLCIQDELESNNRYYPKNIPIAFEKAKGSIIEDVDGNQFIDFFSGSGVLNLGHNNPDILKEVVIQQEKLIHALDFPTQVKIALLKQINSILCEGLKDQVKINFCAPTGADAIEAAIKLARINTRRNTVIAFQGGYHGMTANALSATSHLYHRDQIPQSSGNTHFMPYSYCYRCPFGKEKGSCELECASYVENTLKNPASGIEKPAAILIEPVQSEGGTLIPEEGYLEKVVHVGNELGIPIIFDEIQAGFFRTGPLFSFQNFKVLPDIITASKAFGGAGLPISFLIFKKELDAWKEGLHLGTFRGNQMSFAAGNAAIRFAIENNLEHYVNDLGSTILDALNVIKRDSHFIGDVRGKGMMFGIEYVKDLTTKEPFPEMVKEIVTRCYKQGVIITSGGHYGNVIRLLPPLITTKTISMRAIEIFDAVHHEVEREFNKRNHSLNVDSVISN